MSLPDAETLKGQLDSALRKIREYEDAILHQAIVSHQSFHSLRTQHGTICPGCKQEVEHSCSTSTTSLQTRATSLAQGGVVSASRVQPPVPISSGISASLLAVSSQNSPPCLPGPFITMDSQHNSSKDGSSSGKRNLETDLECEPKKKKVRLNLTKNTDQWTEPQFSSRPATSKNRSPTLEQASTAEWSVTYNSQVEKSLNVCLVRSLDTRYERSTSCLKFSRDGQYLAVGFLGSGRTNIYRVTTGDEICTLTDTSVVDDDRISINCICFSPDGLYLAIGASDYRVLVWEISKQRICNAFRSSEEGGLVTYIDFSPDGRLIVFSTCESGTFHICNLLECSQKISQDFKKDIYDLRFSPDGRYIALGTVKGDILMLNASTGELVTTLEGHHDCAFSVAFTTDGTGLVSGSSDNTVKFWDLSFLGTGGVVKAGKDTGPVTFRQHDVFSVGISSNSRWIISFSSNGTIRVWNAHNADQHCDLQPRRKSWFECFDFCPVGGYLAVSYDSIHLLKVDEILD